MADITVQNLTKYYGDRLILHAGRGVTKAATECCRGFSAL